MSKITEQRLQEMHYKIRSAAGAHDEKKVAIYLCENIL